MPRVAHVTPTWGPRVAHVSPTWGKKSLTWGTQVAHVDPRVAHVAQINKYNDKLINK